MRYENDPDTDLEKKLDLEPEAGAYMKDLIGLAKVREEDISESDELLRKVSPQTYHEIFSDSRLRDEEVLEIADQQLEDLQIVLDENRPAIGERPGYFFRKGYENTGSRLVEDPVMGGHTLEQFVEAREDPFRDTDYVREDHEEPMSSVPGLREFFRGREKKHSDKFYTAAAGEINKRIGDTYIEVI